MKYISNSESETYEIGKKIAPKLKSGDVVLLSGSLGAGKSVLIRGVIFGLGVDEAIPSPTYTLVNMYEGKYPIYHFDFYRLTDSFELYEIGFEDYVYSNGISFIEWPSRGGDLIPENSISINIKVINDSREISIEWAK